MPIEVDVPDLPEGVKSVKIKEQRVFDDIVFPLILSPGEIFQDKDAHFWNDWVKKNVKVIEGLLLKYGAILFRGFPLDNQNEFDAFGKAYGYKEFPYDGGIALRFQVVGNVYTANESPPEALIQLHPEMAYLKDYPHIQYFYCDIPAKEGGNTPLALSNVIYRKMVEREPDFVNRLENEGVRYMRVVSDGDDKSVGHGRGWQSTFLASNKEEAERNAKALGYDFEWQEDGSMKTVTEVLPAIRVDKRTGKKMWFNSVFGSYMAWQDSRNDRRKAVMFPNGDTMNDETIEVLKEVIDEVKVSFRWQQKDVLMLDNRTVQHARDSFVPPRRILTSLFKDHQGPL